jgi:hypothetical protein
MLVLFNHKQMIFNQRCGFSTQKGSCAYQPVIVGYGAVAVVGFEFNGAPTGMSQRCPG